jgi:hypothetical protein
MSGKNIAIPDEIYERVQEIATAEGTTVEELATKGARAGSRTSLAGSHRARGAGPAREHDG